MHKDFYIFRHGETDYNKEGRWQGCGVNFPLNEAGMLQAEALAEKMQGIKLDVIYSSPLERALQTAQIVADRQKAEVKILPELTEGCLGKCEGMLKEEVAAKYPGIWQEWYGDNLVMSTRWPGGESKLEIQQRMFKGFDKMLAAPEKTIGVASHSGSMRYFLLAFGYGPHKMPNTSLFHLIYHDGGWTLEPNSAL